MQHLIDRASMANLLHIATEEWPPMHAGYCVIYPLDARRPAAVRCVVGEGGSSRFCANLTESIYTKVTIHPASAQEAPKQ